MNNCNFQCVQGTEITPWLAELARLRIAVFREWPYLYDGDADYEQRYLQTYVASPTSICVLALAGGELVGASTGLPLCNEQSAFTEPFMAQGWDLGRVFYFGESVLLPAWRGLGIGHAFFDYREAHAAQLQGISHTAFAAVERSANDPRRPPNARDLTTFWRGRGYTPHPALRMRLDWPELGNPQASANTLSFWLRPLDAFLCV
jgi:GNAT superfamily N-acetyltransferase